MYVLITSTVFICKEFRSTLVGLLGHGGLELCKIFCGLDKCKLHRVSKSVESGFALSPVTIKGEHGSNI